MDEWELLNTEDGLILHESWVNSTCAGGQKREPVTELPQKDNGHEPPTRRR